MASKTNCTINGKDYYRITRKIGMKQNKRGVWVADYRQFYGKSRKEAEQKYLEYVQISSLNATTCFGEFLDWFIDNIFIPDTSIKGSTKARYINASRNVLSNQKINGMPVKDITGADLQALFNESAIAPSSLKQTKNLLKHFYGYLQAQHISPDITQGLIIPDINSKRKSQDIIIYTDEELRKFIDKTPKDHRLRLLVLLGINTGARIGELLALTYDDLKNGQMNINKAITEIDGIHGKDDVARVEVLDTKTSTSIRSIPLNDDLIEAIAYHRNWHVKEMVRLGYRSDYVFTTTTGNIYYKSNVRTAFRRLCRSIGVAPDKGFHSFRRTFGSKLANNGVPIQTVSKLMGHKNIGVTAKYYINVPSNEKKAALATLVI